MVLGVAVVMRITEVKAGSHEKRILFSMLLLNGKNGSCFGS